MTDFMEQCPPVDTVQRHQPLSTTMLPPPQADMLQRQRAIVAMGRRAIDPQELSCLMQDAAGMMADIFQTPYSLVAALSAEGQSMDLRLTSHNAVVDEAEEVVRKTSALETDSLVGYVLQAARPIVVADIREGERFTDNLLLRRNICSVIGTPLRIPEKVFGALAVCSTEPREFDDEDVLFVETIAHLASAAISRIRAEESLAEQQRLARGVLQTVEALVLFLNGKGQVVSANPACQRLTGFSLEEIRGRYVWDVFCIPEEAETFRQHMVQLREEKVTVEYESCLLTKHAEQCHITWSCNAIENGDGALDSIIATGIDVTEQYRARAEAERAVQTAEQARQVMARALLAAERGIAPSRTDWSVPKQPADKVPAMTNSADLPSHVAYERRRQPRRAFPYKQRIAPILDEKLPDRKVFEEVQCRDVAASGFSFLHPTPPVSDTLVVALGVPPNMSYLVAQVVHVTRFDDRGQERYLVGCKYIGRASY